MSTVETTAPQHTLRITPPVHILESKDEYLICVDVPGVSQEGVQLQLERGELLLTASVAPTDAKLLRWEANPPNTRRVYQRSFSVPREVEADQVRAELKSGVLSVHLPKAASARARQVVVN